MLATLAIFLSFFNMLLVKTREKLEWEGIGDIGEMEK